MPLDLTQLSQITEPLLAWYEKNARVLPWRENTDAYRVWVSVRIRRERSLQLRGTSLMRRWTETCFAW